MGFLLHATTAELIEDVENPICQICMGTRMDENGTHVSYVPSLRGSGSGAGPGVTLVHGEAMTQDLDLKRLYTRIFSDLPWPAPLPRPEEVVRRRVAGLIGAYSTPLICTAVQITKNSAMIGGGRPNRSALPKGGCGERTTGGPRVSPATHH